MAKILRRAGLTDSNARQVARCAEVQAVWGWADQGGRLTRVRDGMPKSLSRQQGFGMECLRGLWRPEVRYLACNVSSQVEKTTNSPSLLVQLGSHIPSPFWALGVGLVKTWIVLFIIRLFMAMVVVTEGNDIDAKVTIVSREPWLKKVRTIMPWSRPWNKF